MRLRELLESGDSTYKEIYDRLKSECQPFFEISHGFKYAPHRRMSINDAKQELQYLFRIENRALRPSVKKHGNDSIRRFIDTIFKHKGYASRYEYMMSASSLGLNSKYAVTINSPVIFPIGEFKYSYINDDFNNYTALFSNTQVLELFYELFDTIELSQLGASKVFHSKSTLLKFYTDLRKHNKIESFDDIIIDLVDDIFNLLENVKSTDYINAFHNENEIWFNCNEYYALSSNNYNKMIRIING